jgi:lipid-A-disaccharide synthase
LRIPVIYFVSPQLWAWKKHRIKLVRKYIDRMLVIFPFEEPFYRENGVEAEFVGHPLADLPAPTVSREQFAMEYGLDPAMTWIALLPGSRLREIRDHLPEMLKAARELETQALKGHGFSRAVDELNTDAALAADSTNTGFQYLIPLAPTLNAAQRAQVLRLVDDHGAGLAIWLVEDARAALIHARASVVASGTATVEAALIGNPFVVVYRVSSLTYAIAKRVVKVPHVAMANLIAGKQVVPELIQSDFTAANIIQQIGPLLPDGAPRESMMEELKRIRGLLAVQSVSDKQERGAIDRVAAIVLDQLKAASTGPARKTTPS